MKFYDRSLAGVYDSVGGIDTFRRVSRLFHQSVEQDPALRGHFPQNMGALEERLALFLAERTGGPSLYTASRGKTSLHCRHAHLAIGIKEVEAWLGHLESALECEGVQVEATVRLIANLSELANTLADPLIDLYQAPIHELRDKLAAEPSLATFNEFGRNLISAAAKDWDVERLKLLIEHGASVHTIDRGGHNPLYRAANGRGMNDSAGRKTIELLIAYGAEVNQRTGVGGMTPLHMAARRGTTTIAAALLDAGAEIDARDKSGETPLRRAVNCVQVEMVRLLISKGANAALPDKNGRKPSDAARTETIRELFSAVR